MKDLIGRFRFPRRVIERLINVVQSLIMRPTYRAYAVPVHTQVHLLCCFINRHIFLYCKIV